MRINKKYLSEAKIKLVTYLAPWQRNEEMPKFGPEIFLKFFRKRIKVLHYYEPGRWNYFIQILDESKPNRKKNRTIWYDYNFQSDKTMSEESKKYNAKFLPKKKSKKIGKVDWPKHYTEKEILAIYERKSPENKLKVLEKAMEVTGSKTHKIAVAMGYYYTDDYNESTWVKSKSR